MVLDFAFITKSYAPHAIRVAMNKFDIKPITSGVLNGLSIKLMGNIKKKLVIEKAT